MTNHNTSNSLLGDYIPKPRLFSDRLNRIASLRTLPAALLFRAISENLVEAIQLAPEDSFLLPAVIAFLEAVNNINLLDEPYTLASFEFWLNHFSSLSFEENRLLRGKIAGKWLPREAFQNLFPIGMNKRFFGTHFVAAHLSPDVDTTIASFWGWLDAFAARVGTGLHRWALPGGPPSAPTIRLFQEIFGKEAIPLISRTDTSLILTARDLLTREGMQTVSPSMPEMTASGGPLFVVEEKKGFLGEWRDADWKQVYPVVFLFRSLLHWLENTLLESLIALLSKDRVKKDDIEGFIHWLVHVPLSEISPIQELSERERELFRLFFHKVLHLPSGLQSCWQEIGRAFSERSFPAMERFFEKIERVLFTDLFDGDGNLVESRSRLFGHLQELVSTLSEATRSLRKAMERLDLLLDIKRHVLHLPFPHLSLESDVEEMRLKMENAKYLAVFSQGESHLPPQGIVRAVDLRQPTLGTVSFRDFCNQEEVKMASYLQVISVMDHHKSSLETLATPIALIGDAQSCNVLVAEEAFRINDRYSLGGLHPRRLEEQKSEISAMPPSPIKMHLEARLLQREAAAYRRGNYFVHPDREFIEYLFCLLAILDDTDLLTKVSDRDVQCVMQLLNRMKSLQVGKEVHILDDSHIPQGEEYPHDLAKRLLQNEDMYSIYRKIYAYKERDVEESFAAAKAGDYAALFADVKEQNRCARVSQTKVFSTNIATFTSLAPLLRKQWWQQAQKICHARPAIDLHIHMISTIPTAAEVYEDRIGHYAHKDEIWIWVPSTQQAYVHLASFLSAFGHAPEVVENEIDLAFLGSNRDDLLRVFERNFRPVSSIIELGEEQNVPIALLRFHAGSINSRKAMVTPYLPQEII